MIPLVLLFTLLTLSPTIEQRRGPKPKPTPTPVATPTPTPTPTPLATPAPAPSTDLFQVDEFGQVKATNYDTWNDQGGYKVAGQFVIRYEPAFSNFACGKVVQGQVFSGGQQNFMCGNTAYMPQGSLNTGYGWDHGRPTTGNGNTMNGHDAGLGILTGSFNTVMGQAAGLQDQSGKLQVSESIAIGAHAWLTENNQAVIGGAIGKIRNVFFGSGVTHSSAQPVTLQTTGGSGIDNRGAELIIAAGKSTGSATPASIYFSTSQRGVSGSTPQPLIRRWEITPTGSFKALTPASKAEINSLIMRSPSGFCYEFKVSDTGNMLSTQIVCP